MNTIIKKIFLLSIFFFVYNITKAQITLFPNQTANALAQQLVGAGITFTNPTLSCPSIANGKFKTGFASSILIDSGIVLTTGRVQTSGTSIGVNGAASIFANVNNATNGGDADLSAIASGAIHDLCKLEFDFVPTGDTIQFQYRFGSEEYPDFNCTQFNDIFAFFISGAGYPSPTNLALVPGTTIPVTINSINSGIAGATGNISNCTSLGAGSPFTSLYVNNGASSTITCDGLTTLLTAKAAVTPCSTYHMKFAIADVFDHLYDSGVFLKAGSFTSDIASVSNVTSTNSLPATGPFAIEGCNASVITITRPQAKPYAQIVTYTVGGTATNGVDILPLSGSCTIPANGTSTTITVTALADAITEGTESLVLYLNGSLCSSNVTDTLQIDIFEYPTYNIPANTTICAGQSIAINCNPTTSNINLSFNWSPSSSLSSSNAIFNNAFPTTSTTYTLTSSYPGCVGKTDYFTIDVDPIPTLAITKNNITCNGLQNGIINTSSVFGAGPIAFTIIPGSITQLGSPSNFSNLGVNTYTITATSAYGCSTSTLVTISQPPALQWNSVTTTPVQCFGVNNGTIVCNASGGTGIITYQLNPSGVSNASGNFTSVGSGVYTITATDNNNCSTSTTVTIAALSQVLLSISTITNVSPCYGGTNGSVSLTANGGVLPYTYLLNGSNANTSGAFSALTAGNYTITATDFNGCIASSIVNIAQPSQVQINSVTTTNVLCNGQSNGSITVQGNGGVGNYTYTLLPQNSNNTTGFFGTLAAATYTIVCTDANGCSTTSTTIITQPSPIVFSTFAITNVTCNGASNGGVSTSISGGTINYNYTLLPNNINNTSGVFPNLGAGNYSIVASDANSCSITTYFQIVEPSPVVFSAPVINNVSCFGGNNGSVTIISTGGTGTYTYTLTPSSTVNSTGVFSNLQTGVYTITAVDVNNCSTLSTVFINQPSMLLITNLLVTDPTCITSTNGAITVSASGGQMPYTYSLNGGASTSSTIFSNLAQGLYSVVITDANNCTDVAVTTLTATNIINFSNIVITNVGCKFGSDGLISLSVSGGATPYTFLYNSISNGTSSVFDSLIAGNYVIQVTDNAGCTEDTLLAVAEPAGVLFVNNIVINNVSCNGGSNGTISFSGVGGTTPYTYSMDGGAYVSGGTFTGLSAGTHTLAIKDINGCGNDTIVTVLQPILPLTITINKTKPQSCIGVNDAEISITCIGGTPGYTYLLNGVLKNNDSVYSSLAPNTYTIIVTDSKGCTASTTYTIVPSTIRPIIQIQNSINPLCVGIENGIIDWTSVGSYQPYYYTFNGTTIDTVSIQNNLTNTTYSIHVIDSRGCMSDTTVSLQYQYTLENTILATNATCEGVGNDGIVTVNSAGGTSPYNYTWSNGASGVANSLNELLYGIYNVTTTDANSCKITSTFEIKFIPCCEVYVPNAFTPNGDSKNSTFGYIPHGSIEIKSFEIYNRWGNRVFVSTTPLEKWDGTYKNEPCDIGTYYYQIKYNCPLTKKVLIDKGDVLLIR